VEEEEKRSWWGIEEEEGDMAERVGKRMGMRQVKKSES